MDGAQESGPGDASSVPLFTVSLTDAKVTMEMRKRSGDVYPHFPQSVKSISVGLQMFGRTVKTGKVKAKDDFYDFKSQGCRSRQCCQGGAPLLVQITVIEMGIWVNCLSDIKAALLRHFRICKLTLQTIELAHQAKHGNHDLLIRENKILSISLLVDLLLIY